MGLAQEGVQSSGERGSRSVNEMPTSLTALLVIVFALVPGVPGEKLYRSIVGADWREQQWHRVVRIIALSVIGIALYAFIQKVSGLPLPFYNYSALADSAQVNAELARTTALALGGHLAGTIMIGGIGGFIVRKLNLLARLPVYPDAWDEFVKSHVGGHWVVVRLENEEAYAGILKRADTSVKESERDIILAEPAMFSRERNNYIPLSYQYLFLPGSLVSSIAVVYDNVIDSRLSSVDGTLFPDKPDGAQETNEESRNGERPQN